MQKAGCKAAVFCSKDTCSDNPPAAGWYNILYWGMACEQIILASCTWQPKTTYYGVFNLDETAPTITWREIVTKSDLSNFVVTRQISVDVTIPNGSPYSTSDHDITCDIPSGYKYVGILRAWCIDPSCFVSNAYFRDEGKNAKVNVSNLNGTQKNTMIFISVLYAKS